jgi:hypothetical protein
MGKAANPLFVCCFLVDVSLAMSLQEIARISAVINITY